MNNDKYLIIDQPVGMEVAPFRFYNGVCTSAPVGQDDAYMSSQYFKGDILYSEEDRGVALVKDDVNGYFHIMNENDQSCQTLIVDADTPFDAVAQFVRMCWGEIGRAHV